MPTCPGSQAVSCQHAVVLINQGLEPGEVLDILKSMGVHSTQFIEKLNLLEVGAYKMFVLHETLQKRARNI